MAEYKISFKADIVVVTNKGDDYQTFDNELLAVKYLLGKLSAEQRIEAFEDYCKFCGTTDTPCYCMNDD